jgi:hypothetical protein
MVSSRLPLGACVRGPSAWVIWQLLGESLPARIRQLELDPGVHRDVVRQLRITEADLKEAAHQYRDWSAERSESVEVPNSADLGGLERPLGMVAREAAAVLGCGERWITQLCLSGRLAAVKRGRTWFIDAGSVEDFKRRGVYAA